MRDALRRQRFLGRDSEATFRSAIVAIVGLCGGGSHVCQQLAHLGFQNFYLIDPDRVEAPNLNRMIGSCPSDASEGRSKAEVIRQQILRIQPTANIRALEYKWQETHEALRACSLVFGCLDSFGQRDELEAYCRRFLLPYIDIGMDVHEIGEAEFSITGQVIVSLPGQPCMRCLGFITEERIGREAERYGAAGDRPQVVWPNGVLASTAVGLSIALLTPWSQSEEIPVLTEYDGNRHILKRSNALSFLPDVCPHYGVGDVGEESWQKGRAKWRAS